ncbi:MAG TPA: BTAD domain-containing putative transcriptional regulator [Acidimicrobiia bacterium]
MSLLGRFSLSDERGLDVPLANGVQRLLALLALRDRVVHRASVAGVLWPDVTESHAHASLRSALARTPDAVRSVLSVSASELALVHEVEVDVRDALALAQRLLDGVAPAPPDDVGTDAIELLSNDLLPGWLDEWVVSEAEEWRQLRLHALEALADRLIAASRFSDAAGAAMAAVKAEPLRESAHAALIRVHLAESNQSEALRQFERYRSLLRSELGIEPTARISELIDI